MHILKTKKSFQNNSLDCLFVLFHWQRQSRKKEEKAPFLNTPLKVLTIEAVSLTNSVVWQGESSIY